MTEQFFMDILAPKTLIIKASSLKEAGQLAGYLVNKDEVLTCVRPAGALSFRSPPTPEAA